MTLDIDRLHNSEVFDQNGDKIGSVGQVYVDDNTGEPTFVAVKTGLFGTRETFVPLQGAQETGEGLRVAFDKSFVKDAPNIDAHGHLNETEQDKIYDYYGVSQGVSQGQGLDAGRRDDRDDRYREDEYSDARRTQGFDRDDLGRDKLRDDQRVHADDDLERDDLSRDGLIDDDRGRADRDVARSGGRTTGRARLRKYVVTEMKTVSVPVEREVVEVVREDGDERRVGDPDRQTREEDLREGDVRDTLERDHDPELRRD